MAPFLAYLARRKYELQQTIQNEHPHSPYLQKFQGALEELTATIGELPEQERNIVNNLFFALNEILKQKEVSEHEIQKES